MNDYDDEQMKETESQRDLRKFAVFLAIVFTILLALAVIIEPLVSQVIPTILGID